MSTSDRRDTAKVYQFPRRPRLVVPMLPRSGRPEPAQLYAVCDHGAGWYHETAIQEDLRDRKL